jgi:hypothetical protein
VTFKDLQRLVETVTISINSDVSYPPNSKLFCNLCSSNLTLLDAQKEEWFCTRCNVSYFPNKGEKVKRANKFETPGDEHKVLISVIDDNSSSVLRPKKPIFARSLESLKRPGVTITGLNSTVDNEGL